MLVVDKLIICLKITEYHELEPILIGPLSCMWDDVSSRVEILVKFYDAHPLLTSSFRSGTRRMWRFYFENETSHVLLQKSRAGALYYLI